MLTKNPIEKDHFSTRVLGKNAGFGCIWIQILPDSAICWLSKFGQLFSLYVHAK